ncbi:GNAT family N-acetyltransferase [Pseudovibrio sp. WM33]|uniref:GNAT family N-acetyltransferase n=1 Tax=Pseudovibrio sp. WM33 TaxID=1735585 RepID=UPI0007AE7C82|nr:GNAT family N-acetyltransferase [Pseudovibrio sp. WM33]KZL27162.1 Acetyltransferase (GNAT) family protein [Pseudovibrio sp. WM33]
MTLILSSDDAPHFLTQLCDWFAQEWGELDPVNLRQSDLEGPSPLLAISEEGKLIGGLAFTIAPEPQSTTNSIWINALLVAPEHRRKGIASKLVSAAEKAAALKGITELFVYTEYAALYTGCFWELLETKEGNSVLSKALEPRVREEPL